LTDFVQVVQDLRVHVEERRQHVLRKLQTLADAVAIVVVRDVFAPVDHRRRRLIRLLRRAGCPPADRGLRLRSSA
jgi:hypothetical protein